MYFLKIKDLCFQGRPLRGLAREEAGTGKTGTKNPGTWPGFLV